MMDYWNWMFIILILMNHEAVSGIKCEVSDLKINCSSSRSVKFQWKTQSIWKHHCNQYYKITSIENKTNITTEYWARLGNHNYTVKELKEDQYYIFKFESYVIPSAGPPVNGNYRVRNGSTHEAGKAQDLTVSSILPTSAYITWAINGQDKGCVEMYKLDVCQDQRCIEYNLTAYKLNGYHDNYHYEYHHYFYHHLTELEPCSDYQAIVTAVDLDGMRSSQSIYTSFTTEYQAPGVVGDIGVTKVTPNSLTVMWSEPTSAPRCTLGYSLVLSRDSEFKDQIYQTTVGNNRTYTFTGLDHCTLYHIYVKALNTNSRLEIKSTFSFTSVISNTTVRNLTIENVSEDRIKVSWIHFKPCALNYKVEVKSGKFHRNISTYKMNLEIMELEPCTTYNIYVTVLFWGGLLSQQSASITARTPPGVPSQPNNVTVTAISSSVVRVRWGPPDQKGGILNNYTVVLQNRTLMYKVAPGCQVPTLQPLQVVVNGTTTTAVITELPADMQFQATVAAATEKCGSGPPSAPVTSATLTGVSEPVRNMSVTVTQNFTKLWWLPPCNTAGPLTQFLVQLNGTTILYHDLQQEKDLNESCSDIYNNSLLKAESSYELTIIPVGYNGSYGQPKSAIFTVPPRKHQTVAFAIIVTLIVFAIAITSVVTFIVWRRCREEEHYSKIKKQSNMKKTKTSDLCEGLTIEQFLQHTENVLSLSGLLKTEFNILENEKHQYPHVIAMLGHNKAKNRYYNIIPYDTSRVILEGDHINDYINASHIKLQEAKSVNYLACQAPKAATCGDFWKMIFQFRVNIIVMLCTPDEIEKKKGFIYYSSLKQVVMYDNIVITCREEEVFANYIVRTIVADKGGVVLKIKQFHFVRWPEFGVPESPDIMVNFVNAVQKVSKSKKHYLAVQCSAGVGRTGTYIALDALMRLIRQKWNCTFNILDIVHKMRQQRCKMVQTEDQYKYIYECMKYALENHRSPFVKVRMNLYKRSKKGI